MAIMSKGRWAKMFIFVLKPAAELAAEAEPEDDSFTVLDPDDSHATTEVKERQVALRPELKKQISSSEFVCGCCYELLIQPTTLTCGHSFCRLCLANWYGTSNKRECPECRQVWQGLPQVNFLLRYVSSTIWRVLSDL